VDSRWAALRSSVRPRTPMVALLLAELLGACGGGSGGGQRDAATTGDSTVARAPTVSTQAWTDQYVGAVQIAHVTYFGDAVLTQDGEVRLYVGGL
jgi:hypothetical protein